MENNKCKFCNIDASYGNDSIYKDEDIDIYIANDCMHIHRKNITLANKVKINYCPSCGRKIKL